MLCLMHRNGRVPFFDIKIPIKLSYTYRIRWISEIKRVYQAECPQKLPELVPTSLQAPAEFNSHKKLGIGEDLSMRTVVRS